MTPFTLVLAMGIAWVGWALFWMYWARRASKWPTAEGIVDSFYRDPYAQSARLLAGGPSNPLVGYRYIVEGRQFSGSRYRFGPDHYYGSKTPHDYAPGQSIQVHFDPRHPSRCVLKTGIQSTATLQVVMGAFIIFCGLLPFIG